MKPRDSNPDKYRDNVRKSWLVMREVVSQIDDTCYIAHMEPNPGVGYDCLSLVANDSYGFDTEHHGILRSKFMLNRNGQNGFVGGEVISNIWEIASSDLGIKKLANDLIELSGLSRIANGRSQSVSVQVCDVVTNWIERHSDSEFCVSSPGWPGGCRVFEQSCNFTDSIDPTSWPSNLGEPYLSLGIRYSEVARVRMTDAKINSMGENMENELTVEKLAMQIGRCSNFIEVLNGVKNSCEEVVNSQLEFHSPTPVSIVEKTSVFHTPEPWAGNLTTAKIMFLSSNPSIDPNEIFPNLTWSENEALDFSLNRFSSDPNRKYGATEGSSIQDFDRTILTSGTSPKRVNTWMRLRNRAAVLLEKQPEHTSATSDYVMTEVVHCKSQREVGVSSALSTCVSKWFEPVLALCAARVIIVSGEPAGISVKSAISKLSNGEVTLSDSWGSWKRSPSATGTWPASGVQLSEWLAGGKWTIEDQFKHVEVKKLTLNGAVREFCFVWMPHPVRSVPQSLTNPDLYHPEVLQFIRNYLK